MTKPAPDLSKKIPRQKDFQRNHEGKEIGLFSIANGSEIRIFITNYGARIVGILVPSAGGRVDNVVLGYDSIQDYFDSREPYYGATIGRYGNRIANGDFTLNGKRYDLECNEPPHHLHGGNRGFHSVVWDVCEIGNSNLTLRHLSEDGVDGYPGNLLVEVRFSINSNGELIIDYSAKTDKQTIVNLTNHAYFNLSGAGNGSVSDHLLSVEAEFFTPVDEFMIPTGEIKKVADGPFDFEMEKRMGRDWDQLDPQLIIAGGYDHNFVLNKSRTDIPELAARVKDPVSGRILEIETTELGIQFYTANALGGEDIGREKIPYEARSAFCLEPQHFPDSPNQENFPSVILNPDSYYSSRTIYRFRI